VKGVVVFLGPSLPLEEARRLFPSAEFLPPARMGDVQAALERQPRTLCLIDGYFEHVPAVWHKEILCALDRGVRVLGASSMGASAPRSWLRSGWRGSDGSSVCTATA